jgi:hypothetical protein
MPILRTGDLASGALVDSIELCDVGPADNQSILQTGKRLAMGKFGTSWPKLRFGALRSWRGGSSLGCVGLLIPLPYVSFICLLVLFSLVCQAARNEVQATCKLWTNNAPERLAQLRRFDPRKVYSAESIAAVPPHARL